MAHKPDFSNMDRVFDWMEFYLGKNRDRTITKKAELELTKLFYDLLEEDYMHATSETLSINLDELHKSNNGENILKQLIWTKFAG